MEAAVCPDRLQGVEDGSEQGAETEASQRAACMKRRVWAQSRDSIWQDPGPQLDPPHNPEMTPDPGTPHGHTEGGRGEGGDQGPSEYTGRLPNKITSWLNECRTPLGASLDDQSVSPSKGVLRNGCSFEDDLSLGAEANHLQSSSAKAETPCYGLPAQDKRTQFKQKGRSMNSTGSGKSSAVSSVSELLDLYEEDPEEILYNLGFGREEPDLASKVPSRFFSNTSGARGIDMKVYLGAQLQRMELENPNYALTSRFRQIQVLTTVANELFQLYSQVSGQPIQRIGPRDQGGGERGGGAEREVLPSPLKRNNSALNAAKILKKTLSKHNLLGGVKETLTPSASQPLTEHTHINMDTHTQNGHTHINQHTHTQNGHTHPSFSVDREESCSNGADHRGEQGVKQKALRKKDSPSLATVTEETNGVGGGLESLVAQRGETDRLADDSSQQSPAGPAANEEKQSQSADLKLANQMLQEGGQGEERKLTSTPEKPTLAQLLFNPHLAQLRLETKESFELEEVQSNEDEAIPETHSGEFNNRTSRPSDLLRTTSHQSDSSGFAEEPSTDSNSFLKVQESSDSCDSETTVTSHASHDLATPLATPLAQDQTAFDKLVDIEGEEPGGAAKAAGSCDSSSAEGHDGSCSSLEVLQCSGHQIPQTGPGRADLEQTQNQDQTQPQSEVKPSSETEPNPPAGPDSDTQSVPEARENDGVDEQASQGVCSPSDAPESVLDTTEAVCDVLDNTEAVLNSTETMLDSTEAVLDSTETMLDSTEAVLDSTETMLDSTEAVLDSTEAVLNSTETVCDVFDSTEAVLDSTEAVLDSTEAVLDSTEAVLDSTEAVLDSTETMLDSTEAVCDVLDSTEAVLDSTEAVCDVLDSTEAVLDSTEAVLDSTEAVCDVFDSTKAVCDVLDSTEALCPPSPSFLLLQALNRAKLNHQHFKNQRAWSVCQEPGERVEAQPREVYPALGRGRGRVPLQRSSSLPASLLSFSSFLSPQRVVSSVRIQFGRGAAVHCTSPTYSYRYTCQEEEKEGEEEEEEEEPSCLSTLLINPTSSQSNDQSNASTPFPRPLTHHVAQPSYALQSPSPSPDWPERPLVGHAPSWSTQSVPNLASNQNQPRPLHQSLSTNQNQPTWNPSSCQMDFSSSSPGQCPNPNPYPSPTQCLNPSPSPYQNPVHFPHPQPGFSLNPSPYPAPLHPYSSVPNLSLYSPSSPHHSSLNSLHMPSNPTIPQYGSLISQHTPTTPSMPHHSSLSNLQQPSNPMMPHQSFNHPYLPIGSCSHQSPYHTPPLGSPYHGYYGYGLPPHHVFPYTPSPYHRPDSAPEHSLYPGLVPTSAPGPNAGLAPGYSPYPWFAPTPAPGCVQGPSSMEMLLRRVLHEIRGTVLSLNQTASANRGDTPLDLFNQRTAAVTPPQSSVAELQRKRQSLNAFRSQMVDLELSLIKQQALVYTHLSPDDRLQLEQLEALRRSVREELQELELQLEERLRLHHLGLQRNSSVDSLSTSSALRAMDPVSDLLREQLYLRSELYHEGGASVDHTLSVGPSSRSSSPIRVSCEPAVEQKPAMFRASINITPAPPPRANTHTKEGGGEDEEEGREKEEEPLEERRGGGGGIQVENLQQLIREIRENVAEEIRQEIYNELLAAASPRRSPLATRDYPL